LSWCSAQLRRAKQYDLANDVGNIAAYRSSNKAVVTCGRSSILVGITPLQIRTLNGRTNHDASKLRLAAVASDYPAAMHRNPRLR
jgi:hypothetical protein